MSDKKSDFSKASRLVNPTVRNYMETLSLERFYGGYVITPLASSVYNLGIGEVGNIDLDEDLFEVYQRFIGSGELSRLAMQYSGTMGEQETNRLIAQSLNGWIGKRRFHQDVVVSMDGGQNAMSVAVRAFTSPLGSVESKKQYVLLAAPSYPYFSATVAAHAGFQAFLAYDGEQFTRGVETYCNDAVGVILINVPHNPMGYGLTAQQVARIDLVAATYDCVLLVDMVYAPYADGPAVGRALGGFDPERTVFVDSFSKKYGFPGLRLGFAVSAAEPLTYAMRFIKMSESLTPSNVKLAFAGHLLSNYPDIPRRIAAQVRDRQRRFLEAFAPPPDLQVRPFAGQPNAFYLALDVAHLVRRSGLPDEELTRLCHELHGVRVFPGAFVYPNADLAYATFQGAGRLNPNGTPPYLAPSFPLGAQVVYAPDFFKGRIPLLRLSFGMETRIEQAAAALATALAKLGRSKGGKGK
ncbi:MAG: pyridoxal phosphate-dependent aminotransferase, partial [SAR324 cluster bacterium]|nr:pyridoxal phosphate-dependent aminotransferase [SAR324 cluster bacterium]